MTLELYIICIYSNICDSLENDPLNVFPLTKPKTSGEPGANRTPDTRIKSPVLCQLSYWPTMLIIAIRL